MNLQRRSLEACSCQFSNTVFKSSKAFNGAVEFHNSDVLFTSRLLGFNQSSGSVDANNQASSNFRIKGSGVTCFIENK